MSVLQQFSEGAVIFVTGERSNGKVYKLLKGTCFLEKIRGVKKIIQQVELGKFIGMHSSLGGKVRQETCVMQTNGMMQVFSRERFLEELKTDGDLLVRLLRDFCKQLEDTYRMFPAKEGDQIAVWTDNTSANYLKEVGDFYYSQGVYQRSLYAYKKYLQNTEVKIGPQVKRVQQIINELEQNHSTSISVDSVEQDEVISPAKGRL